VVPSSVSARSSPSWAAWLNPLSSTPPVSVISQTLKPDAATDPPGDPAGADGPADVPGVEHAAMTSINDTRAALAPSHRCFRIDSPSPLNH